MLLRRATILLILAILWQTAAPAHADDVFDPTDYLRRREMEAGKGIVIAIVEIDRAWYRRFTSASGSIMLPLASNFALRDLVKARCANGVTASFVGSEVGLDETFLAHNDAIEATISARCAVAP